MNCNRIREANRQAREMRELIQKCRWSQVLQKAEERPVLLVWNQMEENYGESIFWRIWEEDRWVGRDCVRILLQHPNLARCANIVSLGEAQFSKDGRDYFVRGTLTGLLAGTGEIGLLEEALDCGLDVDGWDGESWYEDEYGLYHFRGERGCMLQCIEGFHRRHREAVEDDISFRETTPLLVAILRENVEMVDLLIRRGASFAPKSELCKNYLRTCDSWTIRDHLKEAYGG